MNQRQQRVLVHNWQSLEETIILEDYLKPNPATRFPCLQNLAWKLLRRLGAARASYKVNRYSTVELDAQKLTEYIFRQENIAYLIVHRKCRYLLVGHQQFKEIMRDQTLALNPFVARFNDVSIQIGYTVAERNPFAPPGPYQPPQYKTNYEVFGMTVLIIPWMDGILALPELDKLGI